MQLATISIELSAQVAELRLNRPERSNAIDASMWQDLRAAFCWADAAPEVRVVVLGGVGKNFCSGIDLAMLAGVEAALPSADAARRREALRRLILDLQDCLSAVERCRKPVLAAIGGGHRRRRRSGLLLRHALRGGRRPFLGARNRSGHGGRRRHAAASAAPDCRWAGARAGVYRPSRRCRRGAALRPRQRAVFATPQALHEGVSELARAIATKSPLAIRGSKEMLNYGRDHSVADGLNYVATWNAAMLMSDDLGEAMRAMRERQAQFND